MMKDNSIHRMMKSLTNKIRMKSLTEDQDETSNVKQSLNLKIPDRRAG